MTTVVNFFRENKGGYMCSMYGLFTNTLLTQKGIGTKDTISVIRSGMGVF